MALWRGGGDHMTRCSLVYRRIVDEVGGRGGEDGSVFVEVTRRDRAGWDSYYGRSSVFTFRGPE